MTSSALHPSSPASPTDGRRVRAATAVVVALVALALLTAPALAQEDDDSAPTLTGGERVNATTVHVTVADDTDVDEGSIDAADFSLSDGDVEALQVNESGTDASVEISLDSRLDTDVITVEIPSSGNVTDTAGNALTNGSVTVTGMDSNYPNLREFRVDRINDSTARIVVRTTEPLSGLDVEIRGPTAENLTRDDFRPVDDNTFGVPHVRTHRFPADGVFTVGLTSFADEAGLFVNISRDRTFVRDASRPAAAISGPKHVEIDDLARFDGSESTDNVAITRYEWAVDGEEAVDGTANGTALEHAFDEPGTHEVTLTVADEGGNEATANWSVVAHDAASKRGVTATRRNDSTLRAVVGTNRTDERVRVTDEYGRLAGGDDVALRSLTVTLPTNRTLALNVSGNATAPSFAAETGRDALTVAAIDHGNESVGDPTFRFSVSASRLSRAGISYSDVSLYRHDGTWTELPTEVVRATKSTVVYEADSPGLSTVVVGASGAETEWEATDDAGGGDGGTSGDGTRGDGDGADVRVTEASLVDQSVPFGEYAVVEASLANEGDVNGTVTTRLAVGSEVVDTRPVTVVAGETREIRFATRALRNGTVTVDGTVAGELTVTGGNPPAADATATDGRTNGSDGGDGGGFDVPIPNPLALWPDGLVGTVLGGAIGLLVGTYAVLKALAIYLGY